MVGRNIRFASQVEQRMRMNIYFSFKCGAKLLQQLHRRLSPAGRQGQIPVLEFSICLLHFRPRHNSIDLQLGGEQYIKLHSLLVPTPTQPL
jgi:hypothetical protein